MKQKNRLCEILAERKIITPEQLSDALQKQKTLKLPFGETLLKMNLITEEVLREILSRDLGVEFVDIAMDD
ncbi:unnamed protein product, partial [marine sediment metagenome]